MEKNYFTVAKKTARDFNGDLALALWYSALVDYSKRFRKDKYGFFRVSQKIVEDDLGLTKSQVRNLNAKLVARGIIVKDDSNHGGRTFAGYKLV